VRTHAPVDGQRRFKGRLRGIADGTVRIGQDDTEIGLPLEQIEQARLVPEF
jgi:ribosome maturation factor RimP